MLEQTRSLRVMVVHNHYRSGQPSGEDRVVEAELAQLAEAGHEVLRFERHSDEITGMSPAGKIAVPLRVPWNPAARRELAGRLRAERPDVVHVHSTFPLLSPSVVAACRDVGTPVVATLHNYLQVCPSGTLYRDGRACTDCVGGSVLPAVRHGCYRGSRLATVPLAVSLAANRKLWWSDVDRFLCLSKAQRSTLVAAGMPAERLLLKPNSVPDRAQRGDRPGRHLLFLGRLAEEKGIRVLMAAWDAVSGDRASRLPLRIAGSGPLAAEVERWAGGRPDVEYLGMRDSAECARLLADAAAVAAPSMWLEACPLVLLEAMAAGVPALAARQGAPAELVLDGETGLLHRPGDPVDLAATIRRIVADPEANRVMGGNARRRYEAGFSPAVGLERLLAAYRTVLGRPVAPHSYSAQS